MNRRRYGLYLDTTTNEIIEIYLYTDFGHRRMTKTDVYVGFGEPDLSGLFFIGYID